MSTFGARCSKCGAEAFVAPHVASEGGAHQCIVWMAWSPGIAAIDCEAGEEGHRECVAQSGEPRRGYEIEQRAAHDSVASDGSLSSWPGLARPSTSSMPAEDVDGRASPAMTVGRRRRGRNDGGAVDRTVDGAERSRATACIRHSPCGVDTDSSSPSAVAANPCRRAHAAVRPNASSSSASSASTRIQSWPRPMIGARKRNMLPVPPPRSTSRGRVGSRSARRRASATLRAA